MRYLAIVSFSFAAGVFGAVYGLPEGLWLPIAAALAVLCPLSLLMRALLKGRRRAAIDLRRLGRGFWFGWPSIRRCFIPRPGHWTARPCG